MADLHIGLEGIAIAETSISSVDGNNGELIYRGHWVEEITRDSCYEEIVYLLWNGTMPSAEQAQAFRQDLAAQRELPDYIKTILQNLPKDMTPMSVLRTAISALQVPGAAYPPTIAQATSILAKGPVIVAYYYNWVNGNDEIKPDSSLGHSANYLYMLHGKKPSEAHTRALDTYLMLSADHGMNASTFTSRVVTSTEADIVSAVTAGIGALIGPLHGGAPSKVDDMLDAIGTEENAEPWIREQLENGKRLMGFGHRVYKTYDPRGAALRVVTEEFKDQSSLFKLSLYVEDIAVKLLAEYKPGRNLYPNLEFWAAAVLRTINLPRELYTPTFCIGRIGGWSAQIFEQAANNRLIRPRSIYVGEKPKSKSPAQTV